MPLLTEFAYVCLLRLSIFLHVAENHVQFLPCELPLCFIHFFLGSTNFPFFSPLICKKSTRTREISCLAIICVMKYGIIMALSFVWGNVGVWVCFFFYKLGLYLFNYHAYLNLPMLIFISCHPKKGIPFHNIINILSFVFFSYFQFYFYFTFKSFIKS